MTYDVFSVLYKKLGPTEKNESLCNGPKITGVWRTDPAQKR